MRFLVRYGKWLRLTPDDVAKAERWFDRRAVVAVLVGRCVPLIRSLVSIPAGFRRMNFGMFTLYTAIGSLIWNTALSAPATSCATTGRTSSRSSTSSSTSSSR